MDAPPAPLIQTASGPLPALRARVTAGVLAADPAQLRAAERLQELFVRLRGYDPHPAGGGRFSRLFRRKPVDEAAEHQGLYLVGDVGRGKSMLMDLFFDAAIVIRKRRVHFHAFMQDVRRRLHGARSEDPIPALADALAEDAALLCFDEFQITDIADAILLGRLFEALFARGVVMVATSNVAPDDLFHGRPGRDAFLPFIAVLKAHLDVLVLESARDFRRALPRDATRWYVPADAAARAALDAAFAGLADGAEAPRMLTVSGRRLVIPRAAGSVARATFADVCERPLGAPDYLALATHFATLILDDIPALRPDNYDAARRFITLVDALYEHRVKLIASAAATPDRLYVSGDNADAFTRTASRLDEMQSAGWWDLAHLA